MFSSEVCVSINNSDYVETIYPSGVFATVSDHLARVTPGDIAGKQQSNAESAFRS